MMDVQPYQSKYLSTLKSWWEHYDAADLEPEITIPSTGGVVIGDDGPICAGFAYLPMHCPSCFFERMVGKPGVGGVVMREAGAMLDEYLRELAKLYGYKVAYCQIRRPGMEKVLSERGYVTTAKDVTLMGIRL